MAPQFTKGHVRRPKAHEQSPAQKLGIESKVLKFSEIFSQRERQKSRDAANTHPEWIYFKNDRVPEECLRDKKYLKSSKEHDAQWVA